MTTATVLESSTINQYAGIRSQLVDAFELVGAELPKDLHARVITKLGNPKKIVVSDAVPAEGETPAQPEVSYPAKDENAIFAAMAGLSEYRQQFADVVANKVNGAIESKERAELMKAFEAANKALDASIEAIRKHDAKIALPFDMELFVDWNLNGVTAKTFSVGRTAKTRTAGSNSWEPGKYVQIGALAGYKKEDGLTLTIAVDGKSIIRDSAGKTLFEADSVNKASVGLSVKNGMTSSLNANRVWQKA